MFTPALGQLEARVCESDLDILEAWFTPAVNRVLY